jgi:hypothetical protein
MSRQEKILFSHGGYQTGATKSAVATDLTAREFSILRLNDNALGEVVLSKPTRTIQTRLGAFQEMDFSEINTPGRFVIRAGDRGTSRVEPWLTQRASTSRPLPTLGRRSAASARSV